MCTKINTTQKGIKNEKKNYDTGGAKVVSDNIFEKTLENSLKLCFIK